MRLLGPLLIAIAAAGGSLVACLGGEGAFVAPEDGAQVPDVVNWTWFLPLIGIGALGAVLSRLQASSARRLGEGTAGQVELLRGATREIREGLAQLERRHSEGIPVQRLLPLIDGDLRAPLERFADNRESLLAAHGVQVFADAMSSFATGERFLNRSWSAAADGYVDEVGRALARSAHEFAHLAEQLDALPAA